MKKSIAFIFVTALSAAAMAGCNSNSSNNNNNGFGTNCGSPPSGFQILYPENNAPHVPPTKANAIYVAAKPALPIGNAYNFLIVPSNGSALPSSPFATTNAQIPIPHNSPAPGSTVYVTFPQVPIGPLQTVNLFWNDGGTGCTPNVIVSSFTTSQ